MKSGYLHTKDNVILRSDKKRTIIYFRDRQHEYMIKSEDHVIPFTALSPDLATALYLMDGTRDYRTIVQFVSEYFKLNKSDFHNFDELLSGCLEVYYSSSPYPLPIKNRQYDLSEILPDLNRINEFDMTTNYLFYPNTFLLIPNMNCKVNCCYCYADKNFVYEPLSMDQWEKIIYDAATIYRAKDISVSGGDIFQYPHWKDLVAILAYYHYYPELPTKTPLSIADQQYLLELGFRSYQISLDTFDSDHLGKILQINNPEEYKRQLITSIETAEKVGLKLSINSIQTRLNYHDIYVTMQQLAVYSNIYRIAIDAAEFSLYKEGMESIMLHEDDIPEYLHQLHITKSIFQDQDIFLKFNEDPIWVGKNFQLNETEYLNRKNCNGGRSGIIILPDGKVTCCEELYWNPKYMIGDLKKQTLLEVFDSPERWNIITPQQSAMPLDSPCSYCDEALFMNCTQQKGRCWRESLKKFKREDFPDYRCPYWDNIHEKQLEPNRSYTHIYNNMKRRISN